MYETRTTVYTFCIGYINIATFIHAYTVYYTYTCLCIATICNNYCVPPFVLICEYSWTISL